MGLPKPEIPGSAETRIMESVPIYWPLMCKTERARNIIPVCSEQIAVKAGNWCYISWRLTVLCWPCCAMYYTHIRTVLWNGTEELSFWRNNSFLLNLCIDVSLWEEFIYEILMLSPECLSLRVPCWLAFYSFFPCMVQNTLMPVNLLTI